MARDDDEHSQERPARRPDPKDAERPARRPRLRDEEDDEEDDEAYQSDGGVSTLIPYKNPKALIAYYLGVFSLIPCLGLLLGPPALILGILGLKAANRQPQAKGKGHAIAGIVLGTLTTLANYGVGLFALAAALLAKR